MIGLRECGQQRCNFKDDGYIRAGLTAQQQHRARETLRIFNLDVRNGPLRQMRKEAARSHVDTGKELAELIVGSKQDKEVLAFLAQELENEIAATNELPFATVIKHSLMAICQ